jgi:DNA-binding NtrC family response regulator
MATILLIDDDVDLVEMNKAVLACRGHNVRTAFSAGEARAALADGPPDLVVLDVMMESETAGFDLAREVHDRFPAVPTIILSGIHEATGVPFRFAPDQTWLPVLKFMDKPVPPTALANEVDAALAEASGTPHGRTP